MGRLPDWEARLSRYLARHRKSVFAYGKTDCAIFAAGAVEAVTGQDFYAPFRGKYKSEIGAAKALRKIGNGDLEKTFASHLDDRPLSHVQRGDIVFVKSLGAVGVAVGSYALFIGQEGDTSGLVRVERKEWSRAWANV